jgi:hypothetical protein
MAALTLADYLSLIRGYLDESRAISSLRYSDADITRALNNGGRRIMRDAGLYFFRGTSTGDVETGDIDVPDDFLAEGSLTLIRDTDTRINLPVISAKDAYKENPMWVSQTDQYPQYAVSKIKTDGTVAIVLVPAPTATIANALFWEYAAKPEEMEVAADEFIPLAPFEELQPILLPAAAMTELLHIEAGVLDMQWAKWDALYAREIETLRGYVNGLFQQKDKYGQ